MTTGEIPVYLLPPRPRPSDWVAAGTSAGILLGLAELIVARIAGTVATPPLAILLIACDALVVALAAGGVALLLQSRGRRPSHSSLVGAVLGLLLLWVAVAPLARGRLPSTAEIAAVVVSVALAALALGLSTWLAERAERAGAPASAPLFWGAAALLLAASARTFAGESSAAGVAGLLGLVVLVAAGAAGTVALTTRRGSRAHMPFVRLAALLAIAVLGAAIAPWLRPWLFYEAELPEVSGAPPHVLFVAISDHDGGSVKITTLKGWGGVVYERIVPEPTAGGGALLALPDGSRLLPALAASGYATAGILRDAASSPSLDAEEIDARPGGRRTLEESLAWTTAAPLLLGPGSAALSLLGIDGALRSPEQVTADALRWLMQRRAERTPFFLYVDFRAQGSVGSARGGGKAVVELVQGLEKLDLAERTLLVVALHDGDEPHAVLVRPPQSTRSSESERTPPPGIRPSDVAAALLATGRGRAESAVNLPRLFGAAR